MPADDIKIADMLTMVVAVLESKTDYGSALASNVRTYYQAVMEEEEMDRVKEELAAIRTENHEMSERMKRMEAMLMSLGAVDEEKNESRKTA